MYSIKDWLYKNKEEALEVMEQMKDIFSLKNMMEKLKEVGVDLQPMISIAVDKSYHDLGDILLIKTS